MIKHNFKKLIIWKEAMDLSDLIFQFTESLPLKEKFNLIEQLNRASVSIPSNIAEGSGKRTEKHFAEFLSISLSSTYEVETQSLICERRKFGDAKILTDLLNRVNTLQKKIYNFREKIG